VIAAAAAYCSRVSGMVMRHVLEQDDAWGRILDNAIALFTG
jgi:hypothetical protein